MSENYSLTSFLRKMPNASLGRYFASQNLFKGVDFSKIKERDSEIIIQKIQALEESQKNKIHTDFQDIFQLCSEKGRGALLEEVSFYYEEEADSIREKLAEFSNPDDCAMTIFLDYPEC